MLHSMFYAFILKVPYWDLSRKYNKLQLRLFTDLYLHSRRVTVVFFWLTLTWLCTVFSWLLKVIVRLVEVLGATWVIKGVLLWLTVSYMLTRRLQISIFWKHDFTLRGQRE